MERSVQHPAPGIPDLMTGPTHGLMIPKKRRMHMKDDKKATIDAISGENTPMTIGIVAPSPVPFVVGGAEKLWWGLQEYINKNTIHHCELIKICAKDNNFCDLIQSYDRFFRLDLLHFDMILTTRYPAWMVQHPNHHIYFQHPLRGLYERYCGPETIPPAVCAYPRVKKVFNAIDASPINIRRLFDAAMALANDPKAPEEARLFPGPVARQVVHALDRHAISGAARVFAISETVQKRAGYFPDPENVPVVYHPSNLQGFYDGNPDYLLTVSRLVRPKRISLILKAYMQAGLNIPLKIAGCGPQMPFLKKLAARNRNIRFTGFVSDRDLAQLYSNALVVVFVPENEDLGLVTLEAMHAGKPVITCSDSGGAAELVSHGQTGWICAPNAKDLAAAMRTAAADIRNTATMGRLARDRVRGVSWENLLSTLLDDSPFAGLPVSFLKNR